MYIFFQRLLDFIFPPSEEAMIVSSLAECDVTSLFFHTTVGDAHVLSPYHDSRIRALVHEAKFHGNKRAFQLLNILLVTFLDTHHRPVDFILPIPLSGKRKRTRGYNQVHEILRAQKLNTAGVIRTDILIRKKDTRPQTELKRTERLTNVRDAFGVKNMEAIRGKHILIVDDVTTTGATLRTAKATLLPYGPASVTCVALAH